MLRSLLCPLEVACYTEPYGFGLKCCGGDRSRMNSYLSQLKDQYEALLPPSPAAVQAFDAWVDVEYTYESNAIEGNTLTRGETGILLDKGFASGNKPYLHYSEALDHKDAVDLIRAMGR
jgi:Fic family protein